jgi:hypothetical protein
MLGGGYALLMQAAHPLVAAGIVAHSSFKESPWRRLAGTMSAIYTVVYGTRAEADRAAANVQAIHAGVQGSIPGREPAPRLSSVMRTHQMALIPAPTGSAPAGVCRRQRWEAAATERTIATLFRRMQAQSRRGAEECKQLMGKLLGEEM